MLRLKNQKEKEEQKEPLEKMSSGRNELVCSRKTGWRTGSGAEAGCAGGHAMRRSKRKDPGCRQGSAAP